MECHSARTGQSEVIDLLSYVSIHYDGTIVQVPHDLTDMTHWDVEVGLSIDL